MDRLRESGTGNDKDFYEITYTRHWINWEDSNKEHMASCGEKEFTHRIHRNLGEWLLQISDTYLEPDGVFEVGGCVGRDFDTCYEFPSAAKGVLRWLVD